MFTVSCSLFIKKTLSFLHSFTLSLKKPFPEKSPDLTFLLLCTLQNYSYLLYASFKKTKTTFDVKDRFCKPNGQPYVLCNTIQMET